MFGWGCARPDESLPPIAAFLPSGLRYSISASAMDRFIAMYERPFEFMVVPSLTTVARTRMPRIRVHAAVGRRQGVHTALVGSFWSLWTLRSWEKLPSWMYCLLKLRRAVSTHPSLVERLRPLPLPRPDRRVRRRGARSDYVPQKWCLERMLESPQDTHQFASYVFHKIVLKGGLPCDTQIDMVLSFLGRNPHSPRIRVCTGQMTWGEYFLVEGDMDYSVKVYFVGDQVPSFTQHRCPWQPSIGTPATARGTSPAPSSNYFRTSTSWSNVIRLVEASSKPSSMGLLLRRAQGHRRVPGSKGIPSGGRIRESVVPGCDGGRMPILEARQPVFSRHGGKR